MLITTHSNNINFKLDNKLKNQLLREKLLKEQNFFISFLGKSNDSFTRIVNNNVDTQIIQDGLKKETKKNQPDKFSVKDIDIIALASEEEVNLNGNNIINLFNTLFDTSEINFSLKKCINLTYKKFNDQNKKLLENAILNMMKTTKDPNYIKFGANFFFNKDIHKDSDFKKLTDIVKKLNDFDPQEGEEYLKAREDLFKQEALITFQEIIEPEKYVDRAVKMNVFHNGFPKNTEEALLKLRTNSLNALSGVLLTSSRLNIQIDDVFNKQLTDNILNNLSGIKNFDQNEKLIIHSINVLNFIFDKLKQEDQHKVQNTIFNIYKKSTNKNISDKASLFIQTTCQKDQENLTYLKEIEENLINDYNTGSKAEKINSLLVLAKIKSTKVEEITTRLLTDINVDPELKRTAIWTTGICKNSNNFKILCDLINPDEFCKIDNLTSDEIELKELILYSIAEYSDNNAINFINKVVNSIKIVNKQKNKPEALKQQLLSISETAETLINKIQKIEDNKNNLYILKNLELLTDNQAYLKEKNAYELIRNDCIPGFNTFTPDLQNCLDYILLPFRNLLNSMSSIGKKIYIIDDTVTSVDKDDRGKRTYTNFYGDNAGGLTSNGNIIVPCKSSKATYNIATTIGHEWGHVIHFSIMNSEAELAQKIEDLYNQALEKDSFMDFYSKTNVKEYFAQANEAYLSISKPFSYFAVKDDYNSHFSNTRSKLRRKDPEMFKLLDELYKHNSKINLTEQVNMIT